MNRKAFIASLLSGAVLVTLLAYWCVNYSKKQKMILIHEECGNDSLTINRIIHNFGFINVPLGAVAKFSSDGGMIRAKELTMSKRDLMRMYEFNIDSVEPLVLLSGIGCLDGLEMVRISGFREIRTIPTEIGELRRLRLISVTESSIEGLPSSLWEIKNIESIYLSYNKIKKISNDVCKLSNLKRLHLAGNPLTDFPNCMEFNEGIQQIIVDKKDVGLVSSRLKAIVASP